LNLTKSNFQTGRRCIKRLWNEKHKNWQAELSATDEKNAFKGNRFNDAVHKYYSKGVMIGWGHGTAEQAAAKTEELLKNDSVVLFEAFFLYEGLLCLADVVVKKNGKLTLIEAKSSNNPKITKKDDFEHIYDAAFQAYVMEKCGYKPDKIELLHANGECEGFDLENLFILLDITQEAFDRFDEVAVFSQKFIEALNKTIVPQQPIGKFCKKPADQACPHIETCWSQPTEKTIYDLPRISDIKITGLELEEIHLIEDIPPTGELSKTQRAIVDLIQNKTEQVDKEKLSEMLEQLVYPIHFFDFETYNPAVPMWDKSRPWQQVPLQYSLHILHEDGNLEHFEYLHTDKTDPREPLIQAMQSHFLEQGSIVVYYQTFEKSRITEMAKDFPEYADFLLPLNDRVWDQLVVFQKCFHDHRLAMSKSIKVVLPTFVPDLSYKDLEVQKGDQAQLEWRNMVELMNIAKKKKIKDLIEYCKLDTLAMVELHKYLLSIV